MKLMKGTEEWPRDPGRGNDQRPRCSLSFLSAAVEHVTVEVGSSLWEGALGFKVMKPVCVCA